MCAKLKKTLGLRRILCLESYFCSCENVKYIESTIDESMITCDETANAYESVSTNVSTILMSTFSFITKTWTVIFFTRFY